MNKEKISFEKEVAETLGINTAIILELYKSLNFKSHLPKDKLLELIQSECPFMDRKEIETSFEKLLKVKLIKTDPGNSNKNSNNTFNVKEPKKNNDGSKTKISNSWSPSKETVEVIELGGIQLDFAKSKLKEFKIYWIERSQARDNWNILFIDFIRREWAKEHSSNKGMPYCMHQDWSPNEDVYEVLKLSEISKEKASGYLKEFIIYWEENGTALKSWNSKFIDYVKRKELNLISKNGKENYRNNEPGKFTKGFTERKSDQSWAKEFKF